MTDDKVPPPFFDWRVPDEVQQAARAAELGGMKPNTDFRKVRDKEGHELFRPKNMKQDDPHYVMFAWVCNKSFKVLGKEYFYQYWQDTEQLGPLCLIYEPEAKPA